MSEELMLLTNGTEKESPKPNHYVDDPSFIREEETPEAREKQFKEMQRSMRPGYVRLRSMEEIYDTVYVKRNPIVEGLIEGGTIILSGAAKVGKSFLALQLAYCVSQGMPFLGFKTNKTGVIYFALEDVESRLQKRMQSMFGLEPVPDLYFATEAGYIGGGFEDQLQTALYEHPDIGLVIIDVMQKVRDPKEQSSYNADYDFVGALKKLADQTGVCLVLVHHTRKSADKDIFNMVSGSMGVTGSVDGTMVLYKVDRADDRAMLAIVGRDTQDKKLMLARAMSSPQWQLLYEEQTLYGYKPPDKVLIAIAALLTKERPLWIGTADALVHESGVSMKPNALSRYLGSHVTELKKDYFIEFVTGRTHEGRSVKLYYEPPVEESSEKEDEKHGNTMV